MLIRSSDKQRASDPEDRCTVGDDRRKLAPDAIRLPAGHDHAGKREQGVDSQDLRGIELVEANRDRECQLVQGHQKATEPGEHVDQEQQPKLVGADGAGERPTVGC